MVWRGRLDGTQPSGSVLRMWFQSAFWMVSWADFLGAPPKKACPLGISRLWTRLIDQGPDERQQSECRRRICSLFFAESKLWCMGKQRTLSEPGVTDGEQWTDRAQSSVATCHGLADIFWVQRNFSSVLVFNNHSGGLFITSLGVSSHLCWE